MAEQMPSTYRALQLDEIGADLRITKKPLPKSDFGSAVIRIEVAEVLSYHREVYNGERQYSFPTPILGGINSIGRIAALGPDATSLTEGQLVYVDCVIHARDDPDTLFLSAIHDSGKEGSKKLMRDGWRDGAFAEYAKVPLENCIPLDETVLCKELGYSVEDLMYIGHLMVPFGGLRDIGLESGETIIVCPATGGYGGAGVQVAIAMRARVIAMGRNEDELARLRKHVLEGTPSASIEIVKITGNETTDLTNLKSFGVIDAVLDFTPPQESKTTHTRAATSALRRNGRGKLMLDPSVTSSDARVYSAIVSDFGALNTVTDTAWSAIEDADAFIWAIGTCDVNKDVNYAFPSAFLKTLTQRRIHMLMRKDKPGKLRILLGGAFTQTDQSLRLYFLPEQRRMKGLLQFETLTYADQLSDHIVAHVVRPGGILIGWNLIVEWLVQFLFGASLAVRDEELGSFVADLAVAGSEHKVSENWEIVDTGQSLLANAQI
ncbi:hypothetical protein E8E11_008464 [Didymella keratinophila]|nr:hypothetical protein E8E11_008464 [Didymella keratinophila]